MRKIFAVTLSILLLINSLSIVSADTTKEYEFDTWKNDRGFHLVPLREVLERMGFDIVWNDGIIEIKSDQLISQLSFGKRILLDGFEKHYYIEPVVIDNRLHVPVELIADILKSNVYRTGNDEKLRISIKNGKYIVNFGILYEQPKLYELSDELIKVESYYKFRFMPDGYPAKFDNNVIFENPIYGVYVLNDYLDQYDSQPSIELLGSIKKVADSVVYRLSDFKGSLVFWYPEGDYVSRAYKTKYSGLTQAYYATIFYKVYQITEDQKYKKVSENIYKSLTIPAEAGGVLYKWEDGISVEESPEFPNTLTLNGWLSIMESILEYYKITGDQSAKKLFDQNVSTLERILPLFDAPKYYNSRYNLTGFEYVRFIFNKPGVTVHDINVSIPKEGDFNVPVSDTTIRWLNYVFKSDVTETENGFSPKSNFIRLNSVLSRISYPQVNSIEVEITSDKDMNFSVEVYKGTYNPKATAQADPQWTRIADYDLKKGKQKISIPLSWEYVDLIAYPTNFNKKINDRYFNVYHYIHIDGLNHLYSVTGKTIFKEYAVKWMKYTDEWPNLQMLDGFEKKRHQEVF